MEIMADTTVAMILNVFRKFKTHTSLPGQITRFLVYDVKKESQSSGFRFLRVTVFIFYAVLLKAHNKQIDHKQYGTRQSDKEMNSAKIGMMYFSRNTIWDLLLMALLYIVIPKHRQNKFLYCSICLIILMTLSPVLSGLRMLFTDHIHNYNFIPFIDLIRHYGHPWYEIFGNILLFIPFGYLWQQKKKGKVWKTILAGFLLSFAMEFIQPLISTWRTFDVTDIITNTAGAAIGAYFQFRYEEIIRKMIL